MGKAIQESLSQFQDGTERPDAGKLRKTSGGTSSDVVMRNPFDESQSKWMTQAVGSALTSFSQHCVTRFIEVETRVTVQETQLVAQDAQVQNLENRYRDMSDALARAQAHIVELQTKHTDVTAVSQHITALQAEMNQNAIKIGEQQKLQQQTAAAAAAAATAAASSASSSN